MSNQIDWLSEKYRELHEENQLLILKVNTMETRIDDLLQRIEILEEDE